MSATPILNAQTRYVESVNLALTDYGLKLTDAGEGEACGYFFTMASPRQAAELIRADAGGEAARKFGSVGKMVAKLTKADVVAIGKRVGMLIQWRAEWSEWRVSYPYGEGTNEEREASASYTNDAADAIGTAYAMRRAKARPSVRDPGELGGDGDGAW